MAFAQALPCPCPGKELLPKSPGLGLNGASGGCRPGPPTPCPPAARPDVRLQIAPSPVQQLPVRTYLRGSHVRFTRLWASGTWRGGLRRGSLWPSHPRAAASAGPSSQAAALGCAACAHSGSVHAARPAPPRRLPPTRAQSEEHRRPAKTPPRDAPAQSGGRRHGPRGRHASSLDAERRRRRGRSHVGRATRLGGLTGPHRPPGAPEGLGAGTRAPGFRKLSNTLGCRRQPRQELESRSFRAEVAVSEAHLMGWVLAAQHGRRDPP